MSDKEKWLWKKTYAEMRKYLARTGAISYKDRHTKLTMMTAWRLKQEVEKDDGTVKLEKGKLQRSRKTVVFCPGFMNDPKSKCSLKMKNAYEKYNVNVSF